MDSKSTSRSRATSKSPSRSKKVNAKSKSPARKKSPGRPKSPARKKSPARTKSPARNKSPGRPPKSERKSPGRTKSPARQKSPSRNQKSPEKKLSPAPELSLSSSSKTESRSSPFVKLFKKEAEQIETTVKKDRSISLPKASSSTGVSGIFSSDESSTFRRSRRLLEREDPITNVNSDKILKASAPLQYDRKYGQKPVKEFGGWLGALVSIFLIPAIALVCHMSCTKAKCGINPAIPSTNWKTYFDLVYFGYYAAFSIFVAVLSLAPIARKASYCNVHARLTGFYACVLTLATIFGLYYYGYDVTPVIGKSVVLLSASVFFALLSSVGLLLKGNRATRGLNINAYGNVVYDFFVGKETYPTIGPLAIKPVVNRMHLIAVAVLDLLYFFKYNELYAGGPSATLLCVLAAQAIYIGDALWFEEHFMPSYEAQYEGLGYMSVMGGAVWPFIFTLTTRYVLYTNRQAPVYLLVICSVFYVLGYFIYRSSNSLKAGYRLAPQHPIYTKYETLSSLTSEGKRLLASSWWGLVRHPNYLGDLIMSFSLAAVCGLNSWLPYVFPVLLLALLIHRIYRVENRCRNSYGAAWDRYTQLVKYRLVPRVF